jgi:hypothetical protein
LSAFGGDGFGGGVRAGVAAFGDHHATPRVSTTGGSPVHRVAVGSHIVGNRSLLPGWVV